MVSFPEGTRVNVFMRYKDIPECSGVAVYTFVGYTNLVKVKVDLGARVTEFVKRWWAEDNGYAHQGDFYAYFHEEYLEKM